MFWWKKKKKRQLSAGDVNQTSETTTGSTETTGSSVITVTEEDLSKLVLARAKKLVAETKEAASAVPWDGKFRAADIQVAIDCIYNSLSIISDHFTFTREARIRVMNKLIWLTEQTEISFGQAEKIEEQKEVEVDCSSGD